MKWEYSVIAWTHKLNDGPHGFSECYTRLESYGKDGWELISIVEGLAYFKRPILEKIPKEAYKRTLTKYTHETVQDGYVIFESDGRALPAWEVVKLLNNKTDYKQVYDD